MIARRALVAATLAVLASAAPAIASEPAVHGTATVRFSASSTLHDFSGTAPPSEFVLERAADGTWTAVVTVPVTGLTTGNDWRDSNMRSMLGADAHPSMLATFSGIVPERVEASGRLPFRLAIAGVERELTASIGGWRQSDDRVELDAEFDVSLDAFELKAPSALFMRVDDRVEVDVHAILVRR